MESERPDVRVVSEFEGVFWCGVGHGPVDNGALGTSGDEDIVVDRVPSDGCEGVKQREENQPAASAQEEKSSSQQTSFLCPRRVTSSFIALMSNTLTS